MLSAILAQDYLKAQMIQEGLNESRVKTLIYKIDFGVSDSYDFLYHDGFVVYLHDPTRREVEFCKHLHSIVSGKNIYLMLDTENLNVVNDFRDQVPVPIFLPPFSYRKIAGLFAASRKPSLSHNYEYEVAGHKILLDSTCRSLTVDSEDSIILSNKEFLLLQFLITHPNELVTKYDLMDSVWGRNILSSTATVDVHMSRVRQKMRSKFKIDPVKTVYCAGYIFG